MNISGTESVSFERKGLQVYVRKKRAKTSACQVAEEQLISEPCMDESLLLLAKAIKAETVCLTTRQQSTECMPEDDALENDNNKSVSSYQDKMLGNDCAVVNYQSKDLGKLQSLAAKDEESSQTAMTVLLDKRDELSLKKRDLEDQLAQCDKDIQTILNGGEEGLILKLQSIVDGCNDAFLRGVVRATKYQPVETIKPCEALDCLCYAKDWILPTYRVSMQDGQFQATVIVEGTDFNHSSIGILQPSPSEARGSAASNMLETLTNDHKFTPPSPSNPSNIDDDNNKLLA